MSRKIIFNGIVTLFVILFLYSGTSKLIDFASFSGQLSQSPLLKPAARLLAWLIPAGELAIVVQLAIKKRRKLGLYASFVCMLAFTFYIIILTYFMDYVACDCGGILEKIPPDVHIIMNVLLAASALYGIWLDKQITLSGQKKAQQLT